VQTILESGHLKSKALLSSMSRRELAEYGKRENVGDPPETYEYVMLGNGNCVGPDLVVAARRASRFVSRDEAARAFYPGARFFFRTRQLFEHPRATFDGLHPVKIKDTLELAAHLLALVVPQVGEDGNQLGLVAVVVPQVGEDGNQLDLVPPPQFSGRVIQLDHREHNGLRQWSDAAFQAVLERTSVGADRTSAT
jgi:hypothetical protein